MDELLRQLAGLADFLQPEHQHDRRVDDANGHSQRPIKPNGRHVRGRCNQQHDFYQYQNQCESQYAEILEKYADLRWEIMEQTFSDGDKRAIFLSTGFVLRH